VNFIAKILFKLLRTCLPADRDMRIAPSYRQAGMTNKKQ